MKYLGFGVDGGSTYCSVSSLDDGGQLRPFVAQGMSSPYLPSIVSKKTRRGSSVYEFAFNARTAAASPNCQSWTGWKLLLAESREEVLAERGYTGPDTPAEICRRYYDYVFSAAARNFELAELEEVAIGVPESWLRRESTYDARTQLLEICKSIPKVRRVRLVSEPVAACAYFVHKYREEKQRPFHGHCFVFDAGGGTLDLTVCAADENGPRSRIRGVFRTGVGENTDRSLGASGIAYMEEVVLLALEKTAGCSPEEVARGPRFQSYVRAVETALLGDSGENLESLAREQGRECTSISENLRALREIYAFGGMEEVEETAFSIDYYGLDGGEQEDDLLDVSYGLLMKAYNRRIAPVIERELAAVCKFLDDPSSGISWESADAARREESGEGLFRVILCGGFSNFPLVEAQVKEKLGWHEGFDPRFEQQFDQAERAMAVSYGLTLAANHIIEVIQPSPFSLGFVLNDGSKLYVLHKDDIVREGQPCYLPYPCTGHKITEIVFNLFDDPAFEQKVNIAKALEEQFTIGMDTMFKIGFSLDESLILSLHIAPVRPEQDDSVFPPRYRFVENGKPEVRQLGMLRELYDGLAVLKPKGE